MGDRTSVTLTVLTTQIEEAVKHFDEESGDVCVGGHITYYSFHEVNYGTLSFLDKLQDAGIAYDSDWDPGSDYGSGSQTCRFTSEGDCIVKDISTSYRSISIETLMEKIDDYEELKRFITRHHEEILVLPWDNQEDYGKIFRLKQLINPT